MAAVACTMGCGHDDGGDGAGDGDVGPPVELLRFSGRVDHDDPAGPRCAWTYCGFAARVRGTGLDVVLGGSGGVSFQIVVDGTPTASLETSAGRSTYLVAEGLGPGVHDVQLWRRSEARWGETWLLGFSPRHTGELVGVGAAPVRRLEVVGDSISAGYGNEGCPSRQYGENGYMSYAAIAARALDAELHLEAWSGIGMYRNVDGTTERTMPALFGYALPDDAASAWDFARWIPDVVLVNLGINDFAAGDPGQPFLDAYLAFVRELRVHYPDALLLLAVNDTTPEVGVYVESVIAELAEPRVARLDLVIPDLDGCDGHPTVAAHEAMADQLVGRLRAELGW